MIFGFWDIVTAAWDYLWALATGRVDLFLVEQCTTWVRDTFPGI